MPTQSSEPASSRRAITDLIDEQRGTFLVQYPIMLVLVLSLAGVAAFALTGFLGYKDDTGIARDLFQQSWLLFLWFCALVITLQISIFRDASLRKRLIATLIISVLAVVLVGITYFTKSLPDFIQRLLQTHTLIKFLASHNGTYTVINFGVLAIFWADTIRRWIRRARGGSINPSVNIGLGARGGTQLPEPTMQELVSGDLIAGAVLALLLAGLFSVGFLPQLVHPQGVTVTECMLSWPFGACAGGAGVSDPPTLTFLDLLQTLIYLPIGLLMLALSATLSGFGAVEGVEETTEHANTHAASRARTGAMPIAADVAETVVVTLKAALDRRLRLLVGNLALSLRNVAWPGLIVVATFGLAELATNVEGYLHSSKHFSDVAFYILPAAGWGAISVLAIVFSAALTLFQVRVAENTLRFLGLIGLIVLLTFWIFSLALWGFNQLLLLTHALVIERHPFDPPGWTTGISLAALVLFGVSRLFRRRGQPAVAGAGSRASSSDAGTTNAS
ncbi:MAG: hypothetical protein IVW57_06175 [Ktedonobacterales bacterium]|nr:hypothetical protein [Ktedonobacterales bacterium]